MQIEDVILKICNNQKQLGITLYPGATNKEIEEFEEKMKIKLPEALKTFYRFSNEFYSNKDMFRIIPLEEIFREQTELVKKKVDKPNQFIVAEYMIYSDSWFIEVNPAGKNMYTVFNLEGLKRRTLTSSFADFLNRFLTGGVFEEGGLYPWHDEIDKV